MGAQVPQCDQHFLVRLFLLHSNDMLPPMKSMKTGAKAMSKGALLKTIATEQGFKSKTCSQVLNSFVNIATKDVKKTGLCHIKTRTKLATRAGVRVMFGKEMKVKAKP